MKHKFLKTQYFYQQKVYVFVDFTKFYYNRLEKESKNLHLTYKNEDGMILDLSRRIVNPDKLIQDEYCKKFKADFNPKTFKFKLDTYFNDLNFIEICLSKLVLPGLKPDDRNNLCDRQDNEVQIFKTPKTSFDL